MAKLISEYPVQWKGLDFERHRTSWGFHVLRNETDERNRPTGAVELLTIRKHSLWWLGAPRLLVKALTKVGR